MKKVKQILAWAAVGVLLLSVLTGCSSDRGKSRKDVALDVVNDIRKGKGVESIVEDKALSAKAEKVMELFAKEDNNVIESDYNDLLDRPDMFRDVEQLWIAGVEYPDTHEEDEETPGCSLALGLAPFSRNGYTDKYLLYNALSWDPKRGPDKNWLLDANVKSAGFATRTIDGETYLLVVVIIPEE